MGSVDRRSRAAHLAPRARRGAALVLVGLGALVGLGLGVGCGASARPPPQAAAVRAEVELAERAELARDHLTARRHYLAAVARAVASADPATVRFARREFAETLLSWGELEAASAQLEGVLAVAPKDAASWHDLGMVRHSRGDVAGAVTALSTAIALVPADPRPRIALAALQWRHGQLADARRSYQALLRLELPDRVRAKVRWAITQLPPQ